MDILSGLDQLPYFVSWNCFSCDFNNEIAFSICQLCGFDEQKQPYKPIAKPTSNMDPIYKKIESEMNMISVCEGCMFAEPHEIAQCENCKDTLDNTRTKKYFEIWVCPFCALQEKSENLARVHIKSCKKKTSPKPVVKKVVVPKVKPVVPVVFPPQKPAPQYEFVFDNEQTPIDIKTLINFDEYQEDILTAQQKQNLYYLNDNYRKHHNRVRQDLLTKLLKNGHTEQDLALLENHFENNAQIIVHVHVVKHFQFFVKDTHYRNQFQTNKSSGTLCRTSRTTWQERMFNKKYNDAINFDRVKYGVVNFSNDKLGVKSCKGYGNSHFILKKEVRKRCTWTEMDSSNILSTMGSLKYSNNVLLKFPDNQLIVAVRAAKGEVVPSEQAHSGHYKELQIHGSFRFDRDIEKLCVGSQEIVEPKFLELVKEFSEKFNVPYEVI